MTMTTSKTSARLSSSSTKVFLPLVFMFALCLIASCSQSVYEITITGPGHPILPPTTNRNLIFNADISGTSNLIPFSTSRAMTLNTVGATALRTTSISSSLKMTSGIGIE